MAGECSGSPDPCFMYHGQVQQCWDCGCSYDDFEELCLSNPDDCVDHDNEIDCEACGCTWEEVGLSIYINIGDVWRDVTEIKINIGDVWRTVEEVWLNVSDIWRQIF